jgi:sugar (pentulose or hexulose) kinase
MTVAHYLGFDESTTKTGLGVRGEEGRQQFVSIDNRGETTWHGQPAFDLAELPGMLVEVVKQLGSYGWTSVQPGALSFSVRQHDMVLLDASDEPLIPALSWQCNAATKEVALLQSLGAEKTVGKIEPRFILPKLMWALSQELSLRGRIARVMTTGDYLGYRLTGECRLSTSDAVSNGLLRQTDKQLAADVITAAGLDPSWFPPVIQSGQVVGPVKSLSGESNDWTKLQSALGGWLCVASLGDNHATGVGCGGLVDDRTIVISAGTSGTINRRVSPAAKLRGKAACFEFYDDRMLLLMLADCGAWYGRFVERFGGGASYDELNQLASAAASSRLPSVVHDPGEKDVQRREKYSAGWETASLGEKTAATQLAIMTELLKLAKSMLAEVEGGRPITRFVLTGGLSQSSFFQQVFHAGVQRLAPGAETLVSAQTDELSYQTAAYGALINAMLPARGGDLTAICQELCPLKPCDRLPEGPVSAWQEQLQSALSQ